MPGLQALEVGVPEAQLLKSRSPSVCSEPWRPRFPTLCTLENLDVWGPGGAGIWGGRQLCLFSLPPHRRKRRRHWAVPSSQPVPGLGMGVSGVVVRAAGDKGRLSDTRSDLGCPFSDAEPAADSRPGRPQGPRLPPPAGPPRGVGSGGGEGRRRVNFPS